MMRGIILSAPASRSGKTTVTLGLLRALKRRGEAVQPFKIGPDYIDPAFHEAAADNLSFNLDNWSMSRAMQSALIGTTQGLAIAEGAMGLFDGAAKNGASGNGSSAELAKITGWGVVLVINTSSQAQSVGAIAKGLSEFDPEVNIDGVILNQVATPRHEQLLREGMVRANIPLLGVLPRNAQLTLPERHLGLVQADETKNLDAILDRLADFVESHIDIDALLSCARPFHPERAELPTPPAQNISIAKDEAFSFIYPHLLHAWRKQNANLSFFSPLNDEAPDQNADMVWLPGGYPELHAEKISHAHHFKKALQNFAKTKPVHGECGGYMVLGEALIDQQGEAHEMVGLLGLTTSFERRKLHLGYRSAKFHKPVWGANCYRGHEFHYSSIIEERDPPLADIMDANGESVEGGSYRGHVSGTYFHMIAEANL